MKPSTFLFLIINLSLLVSFLQYMYVLGSFRSYPNSIILDSLNKISNFLHRIFTFSSDAGDIELFKNLEATLSQALPQEATEWRRSFARDLKSVKLSAVFEPFSENLFQNENHYHFLKQPILHVFWLQCAVRIVIFFNQL